MTETPQHPPLSIIIPVLNEVEELDAALSALAAARQAMPDCEVIVVDGGSTDGTLERLKTESDITVVTSPAGRPQQMNLGAQSARHPWLLFLHLDSHLEPDSLTTLQQRIECGPSSTTPSRSVQDGDPISAIFKRAEGETETRLFWANRILRRAVKQRPAPDPLRLFVFRLGYRDPDATFRQMERGVIWRCEYLYLPYGDQGFCMSRELFDTMGGFEESSPMEDLDFVLRLRQVGRIELLDARVNTSARQYRSQGPVIGIMHNILLLISGIMFHYLTGRHIRDRTRAVSLDDLSGKSSLRG